jgi:hypothetical protein
LVADWKKKDIDASQAESLLARLLATEQLGSLKFVNRWSKLRRIAIPSLSLLRRLHTLHIESTGLCGLVQRERYVAGSVTNTELENLCALLPSVVNLKTLAIVAEFVNAEGASLIAQALELNTSITSLDLSKNQLTLGESDGYDSNGGLTHGFTTTGVLALATMLRTKNRTLTTVSLAQCSLICPNAGQLLTESNLGQMTLQCDGAHAICAAAKANWRLAVLDLRGNGLCEDASGMSAVFQAMMNATDYVRAQPLPVYTKTLLLLAVHADPLLVTGADPLLVTASGALSTSTGRCHLHWLSLLGTAALRWVLEQVFAFAATPRPVLQCSY